MLSDRQSAIRARHTTGWAAGFFFSAGSEPPKTAASQIAADLGFELLKKEALCLTDGL